MSLNIIDNKTLEASPSFKQKTPPKSICKIFFSITLLRKLIYIAFFMIHWLKQQFYSHCNNLDAEAFLNDNYTLTCVCTGSRFVNKDQNHIIMSKLKIINNNELLKISPK